MSERRAVPGRPFANTEPAGEGSGAQEAAAAAWRRFIARHGGIMAR
jgi:hypothetical protein